MVTPQRIHRGGTIIITYILTTRTRLQLQQVLTPAPPSFFCAWWNEIKISILVACEEHLAFQTNQQRLPVHLLCENAGLSVLLKNSSTTRTTYEHVQINIPYDKSSRYTAVNHIRTYQLGIWCWSLAISVKQAPHIEPFTSSKKRLLLNTRTNMREIVRAARWTSPWARKTRHWLFARHKCMRLRWEMGSSWVLQPRQPEPIRKPKPSPSTAAVPLPGSESF